MTIRRIDPEEALRLLREEGYSYLDVRSIPEFEDGHPEGAFNVPLLHMTPAGMLAERGYLHIVDQRAGWAGQTDPFGRVTEPGWGPKGLPASTTTPPGHGYESLSRRALTR